VEVFKVICDNKSESCKNIGQHKTKTPFTFAVQHQQRNATYSTMINPNTEINPVENQGIVWLMQFKRATSNENNFCKSIYYKIIFIANINRT